AVAWLSARDLYSPRFVPRYDMIRTEFQGDDEFIRRIESLVPREAMIFQLPFAPFPENPTIHQMLDYDLLRGYLHSRHLAWSYGAVKGREAETWQRMIAEKPPAELLEALAFSGFSGLYLDRHGYPDRAAKLEGELSVVLGSPPLESKNRRLSFFDLRQ